ncbi:MAG TPA: DUF3108 domain-containing protein [Bacteroidia bacterium]|jgi:hypothetical protein|nr:DUF3108 domain-containing protein [Bacteroidia bacterium]
MIVRIPIRFSLLAFAMVLAIGVHAQKEPMRDRTNTSFKYGEQLTYRIHYGFVDAATATLKIDNNPKVIGGRNAYHVVGIGKTRGAFNWFYKVDDRYETFIDEKSICPLMFIRRVDEGGFKINQDLVFDQEYHVINSNGKQFVSMPAYIQDMLSSFFYARTIVYDNEKPGKIDSITSFVDNQVFNLKIKFVKYDTLKSDVGKIRCMLFEPIVQTGRVFKKSEDLTVWISDDKNHIPLRAQANIFVGSIKMDLESYSGTVEEFTKLK